MTGLGRCALVTLIGRPWKRRRSSSTLVGTVAEWVTRAAGGTRVGSGCRCKRRSMWGGWLDLSGAWPILELAEPLTPALREASRRSSPDGSVSTQWQLADDDLQLEGLTVHGILRGDRKSTRLNSSHGSISYAVFC